MDFQLKALGHWSHLYSRSSVWTIMCCSKLCTGDGDHSRVHLSGRGGPLPHMACSPVCGPLEAPSYCRGITVHAGSRSILFIFPRSLGMREDNLPSQRKKPVPEPPSLKATLFPRQSGAGWDLGNPCQMIPTLGLSLGLMLWYTTIIPKFRRLRQENFELEASLYHTARPYLEGRAGGVWGGS